MTALNDAISYVRTGYSVVPVRHRTKNPGIPEWQNLRLTLDDLPLHFNGKPQNIGLLMGAPSGGLVDVDLDHPKAVELADQFLPPTPAVFGRPSKPRSHRLYRLARPIRTKQFKHGKESIVEIRSTGTQTIVPPSIHPSGEPITWETDGLEPTEVDAQVLRGAVERLHAAVLEAIGATAGQAKESKKLPPPDAVEGESDAWNRCLRSMSQIRMSDGKDGSRRLLAVACRAVEHDLNDQDAIRCVRACAKHRPFPTEWSHDEIVARLRSAEEKTKRGKALQPSCRVVIGTDEHRVIDETISALAVDPELFQRGGVLARMLRHARGIRGGISREQAIVISEVPEPNLRDRISKYAQLVRLTDEGEEPAHPPGWLVRGVDARRHWPNVRELVGLADAPFLREDGTVCQKPGYDQVSGVLYAPSQEFPTISDDVTIDDAHQALDQLLDVVCDFRFESHEHQAAWLSGLLTPAARYAIDGPTPMFVVDANVRGAGKGLLVQAIGRINLGHAVPVSAFVADADEMRKQITSIAMAGDRMIVLDNLVGTLGNDALDRALTSTRWKDRLLGTNKNVDLPLCTVFYATGNNVAVGADTIRRLIHIRLDVLEEHPEHRQGFKHPDLLAWIAANRARLLCAVLTIVTAYCRNGRPKHNLQTFGSYEAWSDLVREAIVWLGLPDPCATRVKLAEKSDSTAETLAQLIAAWRLYDPQRRGLVISHLVRDLYTQRELTSSEHPSSAAMRLALETLTGASPGSAPDVRKIGNRLKSFRRRVCGEAYLDIDDSQRRDGAVWRLMEVDHAAPA